MTTDEQATNELLNGWPAPIPLELAEDVVCTLERLALAAGEDAIYKQLRAAQLQAFAHAVGGHRG